MSKNLVYLYYLVLFFGALLVLLILNISHAYAQEATQSSVLVQLANSATIETKIVTSATTGGNKASNNKDGNVVISTGNATTNTEVLTLANSSLKGAKKPILIPAPSPSSIVVLSQSQTSANISPSPSTTQTLHSPAKSKTPSTPKPKSKTPKSIAPPSKSPIISSAVILDKNVNTQTNTANNIYNSAIIKKVKSRLAFPSNNTHFLAQLSNWLGNINNFFIQVPRGIQV